LATMAVLATISVTLAAGDLKSEMVRQLERDGSDVSQPHHVDFYFYVSNELDAQAASRELQEKGFTVKTRRAADGSKWLCLASQTLVPDSAQTTEVGAIFGLLAQKYKGEFDGWEAEVLK